MRQITQRGFSLVELMVAMAIGLLLLAGVASLFFSSKVTYLTNEKTARLQENGRIAVELMVHDIRSAGYVGCAKEAFFNTTLDVAGDPRWDYSQPVLGFESLGDGTFSPALGVALDPVPVLDSDVVVVRMPVRDRPAMTLRTDLATSADDLTVLAASAQVNAGDIMMISDCQASSVFQVSAWVPGAPNGQIQHAVGGAGPGNLTADLGFQYLAGARILPLQTIVYWVGDDGTGPALWRQVGDADAEMLVEGVQALQLAYGEDVDADRIANNYVAADLVTDWNDVISVSLSLLARSEEVGTDVDTATYNLLDPALGGLALGPFDDRRQRMVFTTTAAVRNRAL